MINKSVLLWAGYHPQKWDARNWVENGIGGSEYSMLKLAYKLQNKGYDVTVAGDVQLGWLWGVKWVNEDALKNNRGPRGLNEAHNVRVKDHYDIVIGNNYISFIKHLEAVDISFNKAYFWMHNEDYYPWYKGSELHEYKSYFKHPKLKAIIGVSKFHANILKENASKLFNYTPQEANTYIRSIDNAIDLDDYTEWKNEPIEIDTDNKVKGRIIWSSSPDRGLGMILRNWKDWKAKRPDLSLVVCSPPYSVDWLDKATLDGLKDVEWKANLCPLDLKREIAKAEYWIYCSDYVETYCISALEMMMGKVKIMTTGTGNIMNLIGSGDRGEICTMDPDSVINDLLNDINKPIYNTRQTNKVNKAATWARNENWDNRVNEWIKMINE
ncbi:hypothetical protein N9034_00785 [bacterium]|nr:hypothetical protein [bacterium]MDB4489698.1 hypothetical protein [bacterium]